MDPLLALVSLGGDIVGGLSSFFTADRQARAIEHGQYVQRDIARYGYDALITWYYQLGDIAGLNALLGQTQAREQGDATRAKYYFGYKTAEAMRGTLIAVAGAGLVAVAIYAAMRGEA